MKFAILISAALLGCMTARAQQPAQTVPSPWTLDECIE